MTLMAWTPDELGTLLKIGESVLPLMTFLGGAVIAGAAALKIVGRVGKVIGQEQEKYEELGRRVDSLEKDMEVVMTYPDHEKLQMICQRDLHSHFESRFHDITLMFLDKMEMMNANICRLMGASGVRPVEPHDIHKRRGDKPEVL
jgi:hypothetical protein